jgi:hypothetical protein
VRYRQVARIRSGFTTQANALAALVTACSPKIAGMDVESVISPRALNEQQILIDDLIRSNKRMRYLSEA